MYVTYTEAMCGQIWPRKGPVYVANVTYTEDICGQIWPWERPVSVTNATYAEAMCGQIWAWKGPVYVNLLHTNWLPRGLSSSEAS